MSDRKMIKWQPFNSLMNSNVVVNEIENELTKIKRPVLSSDQLEILENKLNMALKNKIEIDVTYYINGYLKHKIGIIKAVDNLTHKLTFEDYSCLYLETIVDICL
jgi:hypothetical protein